MSPFLLNKYTRWYNTIVEHRQTNFPDGYTERHHIIPKSLGGSNNITNLVALTAREHFICHWLLTKMTAGSSHIKMVRAFNAFKMSSKKNPRKLTPRQYQTARNAKAPAWNKGLTIVNYTPEQQEALRKSGLTKRGRTQTAESNAKRSAALTGRPAPNKGQTMSFKGRVSPTKGMTFEYSPMPRGTCPHCGKEMGTNNLKQHIKRHDAYRSSLPLLAS
jgi:hypothetical protein